MIIKGFVDLHPPEKLVWNDSNRPAWFVSGVMEAPDDLYLHNNCTVHDTCGEVTYTNTLTTSGWYNTESDAFAASMAYYTHHNMSYPHHVINDSTTVSSSKIMKFI